MPIPIPAPGPATPTPIPVPVPAPTTSGVDARDRPYYLREPQDWALAQEIQRHTQALYTIGEWVYLVLMWHELDFAAGLVERCSRCWSGAPTDREQRVAQAYAQPTQVDCPVCFGTTFEGGYRARIVRPAILADVEETERQDARGSVHPATLSVETLVDFRLRAGDYLFRADGSRWRLSAVQRTMVRTGYAHPAQAAAAVAYKARGGLEERTSVAYRIPPTDKLAIRQVLGQRLRFPTDFSTVEELRGPLLVEGVIE